MLPGKYILRIEDGQDSFTITPKAFFNFLEHNNLETKISHVLETIHEDIKNSGKIASKAVRDLILNGEFPKELLREILTEYKRLGGILEGKEVHIYFLKDGRTEKVKGDAALFHKIKEKWASLFIPHPTFNNPTLVIQISPPIVTEIKKEVENLEEKIEQKLGSIISNSQYTSS